MKMAEYINRKAVFDAITDLAGKAPTRSAYEAIWKAARALKKIPAVDVVPVVRCKDCIHYDLGVCLKIYSDGNAQKDSWQSRNPNDFCSYGERKDGECGS